MYGQPGTRLILTGYSFSKGKNVIGRLMTTDGSALAQVRLTGPSAKNFFLSADHELSIRPSLNRPGVLWYDVMIEATAGGQPLKQPFRIVHDEFRRNKVIAHRGAWKASGTAENSIAALKNAISLGCQGSEFDVHMSADSLLFINHDPSIQGLVIEKTPASKLSELRLSNGEPLPSLEQFLKAGLGQNHTRLVLEIKPTTLGADRARYVAASVLQAVRDLHAEAWIDYISFDFDICRELVRLDPSARVAYLNGDKSPAELAASKLWGLDYHYSVFKKNEALIPEARAHHLTLNAWTANDRETMNWLLQNGFDFITTNEPELLLQMTDSPE
ncbi:MAG TPA: glycerophosphodiester phosphodiesterase family protein [Sphingobacteriaceae bacterium]